jgi:hypothetical protein
VQCVAVTVPVAVERTDAVGCTPAEKQAARGFGGQGAVAAAAEQAARGFGGQGAVAAAAEQAARGFSGQGAATTAAGRPARREDRSPEDASTKEAVTEAPDHGTPEANESRD